MAISIDGQKYLTPEGWEFSAQYQKDRGPYSRLRIISQRRVDLLNGKDVLTDTTTMTKRTMLGFGRLKISIGEVSRSREKKIQLNKGQKFILPDGRQITALGEKKADFSLFEYRTQQSTERTEEPRDETTSPTDVIALLRKWRQIP